MKPRSLLIVVVALSCMQGCSDARTQRNARAVEDVSVTILSEPDSLVLGKPTAFLVDAATGDYWVFEQTISKVIRFRPTGDVIASFGRLGDGPSEVRRGTEMFLLDSSVIIADLASDLLKFFDPVTGVASRTVRFSGYPGAGVARDGTLWLGMNRAETKTLAARLDLGADSLINFGTWPASYRSSERLSAVFAYVFVAPLGDRVLVLPEASDSIVSWWNGRETMLAEVPVRARLGAHPEMRGQTSMNPSQFMESRSSAAGLFTTSAGDIVLLHHDLKAQRPRNVVKQVWLTVLDRNGVARCVDTPMLANLEVRPLAAMHHDTLMMLVQETIGDRAETTVRRWDMADLCP